MHALAGNILDNIILIDANKYVMCEWGRIAVIYVEGVVTCISMAGPNTVYIYPLLRTTICLKDMIYIYI